MVPQILQVVSDLLGLTSIASSPSPQVHNEVKAAHFVEVGYIALRPPRRPAVELLSFRRKAFASFVCWNPSGDGLLTKSLSVMFRQSKQLLPYCHTAAPHPRLRDAVPSSIQKQGCRVIRILAGSHLHFQ